MTGFDRPAITFLPLASGYAPLMAHHRHLIDDRVRTNAFRRAIRKVVREGDVVCDLGTGTGILAVTARRAGAGRVIAIDADRVVRLAGKIARDNGVRGIEWLEHRASEVSLTQPVDVLVSECLGVLGVGGTMMRAVIDFRDRHLRPGGVVMPRALSVFVAPVEAVFAHRYVSAWQGKRYGLEWTAASRLASNNLYNFAIGMRALLAPAARVIHLDLTRDRFEGTSDAQVEFTASRAGRVHGFCGWFEADLCPGVILSTAPGIPTTVWRQVFFPLPAPVAVRRGTRIRLSFGVRTTAGCPDFEWSTRIGRRHFDQSTRASAP